jgi:hypothetical protein
VPTFISTLAGLQDTVVYDAAVNGTAENNIFAGGGALYSMAFHCGADGAVGTDGSINEKAYIKMADATGATVGTTNPDIQFPIKEGQRLSVHIVNGLTITNGMCCWSTTQKEVDETAFSLGETIFGWWIFR